MIRTFEVQNFTCYEDNNSFELPGLTIVSGTNNSGKSSLLQSIYLLTQSKTYNYPVLSLNEELKLGSFSDVLNKNLLFDEAITLSVTFEQELLEIRGLEDVTASIHYKNASALGKFSPSYQEENPILTSLEVWYKKVDEAEYKSLCFEVVDRDSDALFYSVQGAEDNGYCQFSGFVPEPIVYQDLDRVQRTICSSDMDNIRFYLSQLNNRNIQYITAFRLGDSHEKNNSVGGSLGLSGQYTAEAIHKNWNSQVDFVTIEGKQMSFADIFDQWVTKLLGENYRIRSDSMDKGKYKITITETTTELKLNLTQVGFGISQLLPIVTMLLSSKRNDIILIENPEVHLHPRLQSLFMDLCKFVVENGRKVVVETHSDHIINRLRVQIKNDPEWLKKTNVFFFEKKDGVVVQTQVEITKEGKLGYWPANFFDQTYHDLLGLIK